MTNAWITCWSTTVRTEIIQLVVHSLALTMVLKCSSSLNQKDHLEDLLAAAIPTFLPANGIRVCQGVEVGKQLEPFALLLRLVQLLDTTGPPSFWELAECKEVAWEETLVGQWAPPFLLLLAQLKDGESVKEFYSNHQQSCEEAIPLNLNQSPVFTPVIALNVNFSPLQATFLPV